MTLSEAATAAGLTPDAALTELQDAGLVSDLVLVLDQIPRPDAWRAMRWLYDRKQEQERMIKQEEK